MQEKNCVYKLRIVRKSQNYDINSELQEKRLNCEI